MYCGARVDFPECYYVPFFATVVIYCLVDTTPTSFPQKLSSILLSSQWCTSFRDTLDLIERAAVVRATGKTPLVEVAMLEISTPKVISPDQA